jgi:hypothetical protein
VFVHGPYLVLEAGPEMAAAGDTLSFVTWKGLPGGAAVLVAVDVNGTPVFVPVVFGLFNGGGQWTFSSLVPAGLSGNDVTFLGFGFAPPGNVEATNLETVRFL